MWNVSWEGKIQPWLRVASCSIKFKKFNKNREWNTRWSMSLCSPLYFIIYLIYLFFTCARNPEISMSMISMQYENKSDVHLISFKVIWMHWRLNQWKKWGVRKPCIKMLFSQRQWGFGGHGQYSPRGSIFHGVNPPYGAPALWPELMSRDAPACSPNTSTEIGLSRQISVIKRNRPERTARLICRWSGLAWN